MNKQTIVFNGIEYPLTWIPVERYVFNLEDFDVFDDILQLLQERIAKTPPFPVEKDNISFEEDGTIVITPPPISYTTIESLFEDEDLFEKLIEQIKFVLSIDNFARYEIDFEEDKVVVSHYL